MDIKSTDIGGMIQSYKDKFEVSELPSYKEITVFIDDFEKQKLKPQHLDNLLKKLADEFSQVVIFIDKKQFIQSQNKYIKHGFREAEILPFGYKKRHELIKKWVLLESNNDQNIVSDEVYNRIDLFSRNFDSIIDLFHKSKNDLLLG